MKEIIKEGTGGSDVTVRGEKSAAQKPPWSDAAAAAAAASNSTAAASLGIAPKNYVGRRSYVASLLLHPPVYIKLQLHTRGLLPPLLYARLLNLDRLLWKRRTLLYTDDQFRFYGFTVRCYLRTSGTFLCSALKFWPRAKPKPAVKTNKNGGRQWPLLSGSPVRAYF